jgi:hypothetical protein
MAKYCDSAKLEENWFFWLLAIDSPELDIFRARGILWTKPLGHVEGKNGVQLVNPSHPERLHCLALKNPVSFQTTAGKVQTACGVTPNDKVWTGANEIETDEAIVAQLRSDGFYQEIMANTAWHSMLTDINNMCMGIATKFRQASEEETNDLANEALSLVTLKLIRKKLVYIPGKAPVFNLLTTTIYRCIYSILNKRKNQREGFQKLVDSMQRGRLPNHRSFRIGTSK